MNALLDWLDNRTGYKAMMHEALYERIPGGARWRYVWGSTLTYTFVLQLITGVFLWTAYSPSAQTAWESVYFIQNVMAWGWVIRGIHHYAAQAMVVLMALHLMQVVIDGAYKAPREINFWLGLILMQIVLGLSLTGYLLPWDQKGYYATKVATNIAGATPVVGQQIQQVVQGGDEYGHHTLTRFFALHVGILPGGLVFFLVLHLAMFRKHGLTVPNPDRAPEVTFWPDQILKDGVACLAVLATVLGLTWYTHGAELSAPADPAEPYSAARPEWYFLFLFRFLRFEAVDKLGLAVGAIYIPGALFTFLILMPLIAKWKHGHRLNVGFMAVMTVIIIGLTGMAFRDDREDVAHQAAITMAEENAHRVQELASAPEGIPAQGAVFLLRNDPYTQGPKIFKKYCSTCHHYEGHNGLGGQPEGLPTAPDLGHFGSREWFREIITNYRGHSKPFENAENTKKFLEGDNALMAKYSAAMHEQFSQPEMKPDLEALVEFLVAQGERTDIELDGEKVIRGKALFSDEKFTENTDTFANCSSCHVLVATGDAEALGGKGGDYPAPHLTRYGNAAWLQSFIKNPATPEHYGFTADGEEKVRNEMPLFENQLDERELDLLVRWLRKDYVPHVEPERPEEILEKAEQEQAGK